MMFMVPVASHHDDIFVSMVSLHVNVRPVIFQLNVVLPMPAFRVLVEENGHCEQQKQDSNTKHNLSTPLVWQR